MTELKQNIDVSSVDSYQIENFHPRGGSTMIEIDRKLIIFGGADRTGHHSNDLIVRSTTDNTFSNPINTGDIPTERSGHAVAKYGHYMLLFGGVNFVEEIDYNDLYILDTVTMAWKYVGESGIDVKGRNSHSLCVLASPDTGESYLVLYGGASGEHGPLGDTIYAKLPRIEDINISDFYVEWKQLTSITPGPREMHSSSSTRSSLIITGGRNDRGELLTDAWILSFTTTSDVIQWKQIPELELDVGRCSHGSAIISCIGSSHLCLFGGIDSTGNIGSSVITTEITKSMGWRRLTLGKFEIEGRFGTAMCSSNTDEALDGGVEMNKSKIIYIFGGVNAEKDFNDVIIINVS